ncbi:pyruvate/2-oxoglutarate dehydrogenase complex dihydrolipoamide acyltransferase (E2) component [Cryobacterium sp. MP_M5]|uniref:biotin/lipoyl-containing protein n=1 Tax=unclassified Cryobacterium TaxID=2649013 RepID=UPI0018C9F0D4|nr:MULTISPECIES: biotin/lipoyl-containing protein [unclassified Cryobacterium]MBG6057324.1 pyruvate/2-oxoglutarate dehydrogenase complex dihydrolipoamide acyltransferase (E2) component [Cryobacterium sp. MP_M3]MEC5175523.1 pyruvate/2-oxoglutarate dehydrogenase complex dihydrolipoamide acyltransferase (E2) component [Cryobacterium sp. MP_M5]
MSDILFPRMSDDDDATGVLVTWFVESGEQVKPTTLVAEVAMDKVDAEVYPETGGVITLLVDEGAQVAQGSPIARIG